MALRMLALARRVTPGCVRSLLGERRTRSGRKAPCATSVEPSPPEPIARAFHLRTSRNKSFVPVRMTAVRLTPARPRPAEFFRPLIHVENVLGQAKPTAGFEDGNQLVELRPGMRSSDDDPDGVKKFLAFGSGFSLYLINMQLKAFRSESASLRRFVFQYLDRESVQNGIGVRPGKNLGIIRCRQRGLCVVVKDEGCAFPQLVQAVDRWQ